MNYLNLVKIDTKQALQVANTKKRQGNGLHLTKK